MLNIIQVPNTSIGKQMSINSGFYLGKYFYEMVKLTSKEIGYEFEYEEYKGSLTDLPEGTAIQLQSPGQPSMHFVRQEGLWHEITLGESITSFSIESSSHATVTILYKPE